MWRRSSVAVLARGGQSLCTAAAARAKLTPAVRVPHAASRDDAEDVPGLPSPSHPRYGGVSIRLPGWTTARDRADAERRAGVQVLSLVVNNTGGLSWGSQQPRMVEEGSLCAELVEFRQDEDDCVEPAGTYGPVAVPGGFHVDSRSGRMRACAQAAYVERQLGRARPLQLKGDRSSSGWTQRQRLCTAWLTSS